MSRATLIGENSITYSRILIDIWNNNDCTVLIDCQIPSATAADIRALPLTVAMVKKFLWKQG